jgi:hypothetical protein
MRKIMIVLSAVYLFCLIRVGGAVIVLDKAKAEKNARLTKTAQKLNPFDAAYFYEDYRLTGDLKAMQQAVRLEPTKPAYHMYYGLALIKQEPRPRTGDQAAVTEICKAAELKKYSNLYKNICAEFRENISQP